MPGNLVYSMGMTTWKLYYRAQGEDEETGERYENLNYNCDITADTLRDAQAQVRRMNPHAKVRFSGTGWNHYLEQQ
jgi:hypothetical protein